MSSLEPEKRIDGRSMRRIDLNMDRRAIQNRNAQVSFLLSPRSLCRGVCLGDQCIQHPLLTTDFDL